MSNNSSRLEGGEEEKEIKQADFTQKEEFQNKFEESKESKFSSRFPEFNMNVVRANGFRDDRNKITVIKEVIKYSTKSNPNT